MRNIFIRVIGGSFILDGRDVEVTHRWRGEMEGTGTPHTLSSSGRELGPTPASSTPAEVYDGNGGCARSVTLAGGGGGSTAVHVSGGALYHSPPSPRPFPCTRLERVVKPRQMQKVESDGQKQGR
ncbi:MAG: hypothetical protein FE78DRAFT_100234 [Acidomyces sp. 'richmondensis']|nr:MAG: hypothetical protein FE78DRAFT_100234 [Acidomyces sp. 'richmondensis']